MGDIRSIAFFTLGLVFLYQRDWLWYYVVFAVATLNRETIAFLAVVYVITAIGKSNVKSIGWHCVGQAVIWVGIKYGLYLLYGDNSAIEVAGEPAYRKIR